MVLVLVFVQTVSFELLDNLEQNVWIYSSHNSMSLKLTTKRNIFVFVCFLISVKS